MHAHTLNGRWSIGGPVDSLFVFGTIHTTELNHNVYPIHNITAVQHHLVSDSGDEYESPIFVLLPAALAVVLELFHSSSAANPGAFPYLPVSCNGDTVGRTSVDR